MTKSSVALLATVFAITAAHAQVWPNWSKQKILPPVEYDHPYPGKLTIYRVKTQDEVRFFCMPFRSGPAYACNLRWEDIACTIYIAADEVLAEVGLTYEITLRHEIGHCNGWKTPDHADARYIEPTVDPFVQPIGKPFLLR
jgi:hypothetical protein